MSLIVIGTPIGNPKDITLRALEALENTKYIIGEEPKTLRKNLASWGIPPRDKEMFFLNEHSTENDIQDLTAICRENTVCLVSDCGTPSFYDPGYSLVKSCKTESISIKALPGVSSLTALLPYVDQETPHFSVAGFPPQKDEKRSLFYKKLQKNKESFFILDTPYRLQKTLKELDTYFTNNHCVLGLNLTQENELIVYGKPSELKKECLSLKKENFVCFVLY